MTKEALDTFLLAALFYVIVTLALSLIAYAVIRLAVRAAIRDTVDTIAKEASKESPIV
jgi:hypothetical protein